jgi:hypothetical protein
MCQSSARVVPGGSYTSEDAELFDQLRDLLLDLRLPAFEAERLALELQRADASGSGLAALVEIAQATPALSPLRRAVTSSATVSPHRAVLMLATILTGLASAARRSGTIAAVAVPDAEAGG